MAVTINASTSSGLVQTADTSGQIQLQSNGTATVTVDTSGNVGIGTTSPATYGANTHSLSLNGTGNYQAVVWQVNGTVVADAYTNGTSGFILGTENSSPLQFQTNVTERMRIDSSGNVLIGQTSDNNNGVMELTFADATRNGLIFNGSNSSTGAYFVGFRIGGTQIGSITRNAVTSAVLYNTTSDKRLKENIKDAQPVLDVISNIKVRQYDWIGSDSHQDYGFIAQELNEVVNDVVTKGKTDEDMWSVDYSKLTPHLVKAIQEQQELIKQLQADVAELKAKGVTL